MSTIFRHNNILIISFILIFSSCAYFNTLYNAQQYFNEAEKIRLEKEGKAIPLSAMDKYSKTIQKCQKSLSKYPDSRWRIDAYLLMGKATYYRKDYETAVSHLNEAIENGNENQIHEANYWAALCKWKKGSSQVAVLELKRLLTISKDNRIKARCHLSLSDIALEESRTEEALDHLERGAKITKDRAQRGVIYGQLAELAFKKGNYIIANSAYEKVITNSLAKDKVEHAHLQILKMLRLNNNYRSASRKLKTMLTNEKFKNIGGNLELELAKLYKHQGEIDEAVNRLLTIVNDRQRTPVSAEAYYLLGQIYSDEKWEPKKARDYYKQVSKESAKSIYKPSSISKITSIDKYLTSLDNLEKFSLELILIDSTDSLALNNSDTTQLKELNTIPKQSKPEILYQLGDLEAFTFERLDKGIGYFNQIVHEHSDSPFHSKALFTLTLIYRNLGDTLNAIQNEETLLDKYPNSDFSSHLRSGIEIIDGPEELLYRKAEKQWLYNPDSARQSFRTIINYFSQSELSSSAAYFLGFEFDNSAEIDSAVKYYSWIKDNHPNSDQAIPAKDRLKTLQLIISEINPDTSNVNKDNKIEN
ncbi:MAG: hypothetical protein CMG74_08430 [Candidatus Marinimicrobia bacterium]|nr:hypothetical protein [Candidatus Neomarinimicrobiota bacterium]|tara:strand:- start:17117 stop:18880 length:1764 start_codon:yes stop_codon:yes gene_type:complete